MCFGYLNSVFRLLQIRACDHKLLAPRVKTALDDIFEIILMPLSSMMQSTKYRICEVDANLEDQSAKSHGAD